jgi:formylglycine-generating enzyme required for sulfatase activity/AAA+ ATPase superfamily predicted ATPase
LVSKGFLSPTERVAAGSTLADLGDPRFREDAWYLPDESLLGFVEVEAGPFLMGGDPDTNADVPERELPMHEVDLPTYYIARYPVTVMQFQVFVQDSGYQAQGPWREFSGQGNHPVVGLTWYDAIEYCKWLTEKLEVWNGTPEPLATHLQEKDCVVQLPTEAEWEKAARGTDGRLYPWGEDPDISRANYDDTGLGDTSPVGCFVNGASPFGSLDMSGNVWEMCHSLYRPYPYTKDDGREKPGAQGSRVLRGGAWADDAFYGRCAYRGNRPADSYGRDCGFRVAISTSVAVDPILEQVLVFFNRAHFQTERKGLISREVVINTSKWVSHSDYGGILVKIFASDLNGDQLREIEERINRTGTSAELAYAVYEGELLDDAFWQLIAYKQGGLTIVPLKVSAISGALVSDKGDCYTKLKDLQEDYIGHVNPYEWSNAIKDPTWFIGRRKEAADIIARLESLQHAGIFGMRKIGKTSLLFFLKHQLIGKSIPVAYIGLQARGEINPSQLFRDVVKQTYGAIAQKIEDMPTCRSLENPVGKVSAQIFKEDIRGLWKVAQETLGIPFMVVMIDEAERLIPSTGSGEDYYAEEAGLFEMLMRLMSRFRPEINRGDDYRKYDEFFAPIRDLSQDDRCLASVVTSARPTIRREFDKDVFPSGNTMFELYDETYLGNFDLDTCEEMIVKIGKWIGVDYSENSLKAVYEETDGHPYIARILCASIVADLEKSKVTVEEVEQAVPRALDRLNEYFRGWWINLRSEEREIIESIFKSQDLPKEMSEEHRDALRHLRKEDVVCKTEMRNWRLTIPLLRKWLEKRKGD